MVHIVAIDALSFHKPKQQFEEFLIRRELNKAFCGFYSCDEDESPIPVASGNWGCGAFKGFNRLKCLIQLMACVASRRNLVYYTFNDFELLLEMEEMFQFLQENSITVAQLWRYLTSFKEKRNFELLYHHIHEQFKAEKLLEGLDFKTDSKEFVPKENLLDLESEEDLENPTKKMKIDDATSSNDASENHENESESAAKERKITDYFTKN